MNWSHVLAFVVALPACGGSPEPLLSNSADASGHDGAPSVHDAEGEENDAAASLAPYADASAPPERLRTDASDGVDAGRFDAGLHDAGLFDAGLHDAGLFDAGLFDASTRPDGSDERDFCGGRAPRGADAAGPLSFAAPRMLVPGVCTAAFDDFDADGDLDLVSVGCDGALTWREQEPDGFAGAARMGEAGMREMPQQIWFGDLDGDGNRDIILRSSCDIEMIHGDGRGGLEASRVITSSTRLTADTPRWVCYRPHLVADLDRDGRAEIVSGDRTLRMSDERVIDVVLHRDVGLVEIAEARAGHIGVLDDDLDVLGMTRRGGILFEHRGGRFSTVGTLASASPRLEGSFFEDLDGDCRSDFVSINLGSAGGYRFCAWAAPEFSAGLVSSEATEIALECGEEEPVLGSDMADVDADGDPDLVICDLDGLLVQRNHRGRLRLEGERFPLAPVGPIRLYDVDLDGDADVLLAHDIDASPGVDYWLIENTTRP